MPNRNLSALLEGINVEETQGDVSVSVNAVAYDSRSVTPGALFVALPGLHLDGHDYLQDAVARGATALVVERPLEPESGAVLPTVVRVTDSRRALSALAAAFYDHPSQKLRVIGVTGTDGKSSTCAYIHQLLTGLGKRVGLLSTVSVDRGKGIEDNPFRQSTPEAPEVHRFLREMVDAGLEYAVVEATSHGLSEKTNRLADIAFDVAVFTNLSHEHLEFHGSYEQYRSDKANLFRALDRSPDGFGVVNAGDKEAGYFAAQTTRRVVRYGIECPDCDLSATSVKGDISGTRFTVSDDSTESKTEIAIPGSFQVENTLAALLTATTLTGSKVTQCCSLVPGITPVPGRMVRVGRALPFSVFIDYAHTPGAFERVLPLLRGFTTGRLIAVFGSAGERDVEKRELQGSIAAKYADILVITDEDPRQEDARSILKQIAEGARTERKSRARHGDIILIADRRKAIHHALSLAKANDTVVLLGKGHEKSIIYPEGPVPWDEQEAATEALKQLGFGVLVRLALIYGGRSGEHEVSCRSAASILRNLDSRRYDVVPVAIDHDGVWYLQKTLDPNRIGDALEVDTSGPRVAVLPGSGLSAEGRPLEIEVAFPILHGSFGEDGTVQGLLEMAGIAYVGSGVLASATGMDKETMKRLWREAGLPTAPFVTFRDDLEESTIVGRLESAGLSAEEELFVKPARGGSSVGIGKVKGLEALRDALSTAFRYDTKAIVERRIVGREIECAVIGNREVETFPPGEIVPKGGFYDYDAKYVDPEGARLLVPAELPPETLDRVRECAAEAYRTLEAEGYSRVDLFVAEDGTIYLNEINTIPGFTTISMFPRMCQVGGLTYATLLDRLIDLGLERHRQRERLEYRYE